MSTRIAIDTELLRQHAGRVEQVGRDVGVARDAAGSLDLGGGAFGLMCAFLVPPAVAVSSVAQAAIASAQRMVERSATELRGVAADFTAQEDRVEETLRSVRTRLDQAAS